MQAEGLETTILIHPFNVIFDKDIIHRKTYTFNKEIPLTHGQGNCAYLMEKEIIVPAPFLAISTEKEIPPPIS